MESDRLVQVWVIVIFLVVVVGVTILAALSSKGTVAPSQTGFQATVAAAITAADWVHGNKNAQVSIIEYGDFQCPACAAYEPFVEQLEKEYASNTRFVFRNYPLPQHGNAMITAQAAEAAGLQGKYWEMHDLLYQKQTQWTDASGSSILQVLDAYAQTLGLNVVKFKADINSTAVKEKIQGDKASGNAARVDHTPTFFINLTQVPNPRNYAEFKSAIDAALASSTAR